MVIYTVTTMSKIPSIESYEPYDCRCVGWFQEFDDADQAVRHNNGDIYEVGSYPYAIIEKIDEGFYGTSPHERTLYEFNRKTEMYEPIPEPETLKHLCGFGIG